MDVFDAYEQYRHMLHLEEKEMNVIMDKKQIWDHIKDYVEISHMEVDPTALRLTIDGKVLEVFVSDTGTLIMTLKDARRPDNQTTFDLKQDYEDVDIRIQEDDLPF